MGPAHSLNGVGTQVNSTVVKQAHRAWCGHDGEPHRAPARVNLIGEHTDYTGGLVLPMASEFHTVAVLSLRGDRMLRLNSVNYKEERELSLDALAPTQSGHWSEYAFGVAWALRQKGIDFGGADITLDGDVPLGAGLSSSASVESAVAMALLQHAGARLPLEQLAVVCRSAENDYVGAKSGIMDQFIVLGGIVDRAMLLDTRSLTYDLLPLPKGVRIVVCNSMVQHSVATGDYGNRSDETKAAAAAIAALGNGLTIRDASVDDLARLPSDTPAAVLRRGRHIITENARVLAARDALHAGDMIRFGELLNEAHASFRDDFEASAPEVETIVAIARRQPGCYGARITGGGFGGCTVNLVEESKVDAFLQAVRAEYLHETGLDPQCFVCTAADGALALEAKESAQ
jgi:galactokinase